MEKKKIPSLNGTFRNSITILCGCADCLLYSHHFFSVKRPPSTFAFLIEVCGNSAFIYRITYVTFVGFNLRRVDYVNFTFKVGIFRRKNWIYARTVYGQKRKTVFNWHESLSKGFSRLKGWRYAWGKSTYYCVVFRDRSNNK